AFSPHGLRAFKADVDDVLTPVERLLSGIELTRECSPRSLDAVISAGERISAALVARALNERGVSALAVDARDFVVTDANHGAAAPRAAAVGQRGPRPRLGGLFPTNGTTVPPAAPPSAGPPPPPPPPPPAPPPPAPPPPLAPALQRAGPVGVGPAVRGVRPAD